MKINKPNPFLPIVSYDEFEEHPVFDWDNIFKNIRRYKKEIAKVLNISDENQLRKYILYYVNWGLQEMEHQGEVEVYKDITLEDFLKDIKSSIEIEHEEADMDEYIAGDYTIEDIFGSK